MGQTIKTWSTVREQVKLLRIREQCIKKLAANRANGNDLRELELALRLAETKLKEYDEGIEKYRRLSFKDRMHQDDEPWEVKQDG